MKKSRLVLAMVLGAFVLMTGIINACTLGVTDLWAEEIHLQCEYGDNVMHIRIDPERHMMMGHFDGERTRDCVYRVTTTNEAYEMVMTCRSMENYPDTWSINRFTGIYTYCVYHERRSCNSFQCQKISSAPKF